MKLLLLSLILFVITGCATRIVVDCRPIAYGYNNLKVFYACEEY